MEHMYYKPQQIKIIQAWFSQYHGYHWYNTSNLMSKLDNSFSMTSLDHSFIFGGKTIIQFWKRIHSSMKQVLKVAFDFNLYFLLNFMKLYIPWISFVYNCYKDTICILLEQLLDPFSGKKDNQVEAMCFDMKLKCIETLILIEISTQSENHFYI